MTPDARSVSHHLPHVLAQFDVDAGGRLVEKQDLRFVRQRLGDHQAALHAAGQRRDFVVLLVPQRQVLQHFLDIGRKGRLAEQAAAERHRRPHRRKHIGRKLLRHEPDQRAGDAVIGDDVVPVHQDAAARRIDDAADDADQRRLAGAVGAEQRENLAVADFQVDVLERLKAGGVGLVQMRDGNGGGHDGRERRLTPKAAPLWTCPRTGRSCRS